MFTLIGSLRFAAKLSHECTTICTTNVHTLPSSVGVSMQVTLVWLVVVGQLPQFDARML